MTMRTDIEIEGYVLENKNHPHTDWVPAHFARQMEEMLVEAIEIARNGRYPATDFVAVGKRLDVMEDFLSNS